MSKHRGVYDGGFRMCKDTGDQKGQTGGPRGSYLSQVKGIKEEFGVFSSWLKTGSKVVPQGVRSRLVRWSRCSGSCQCFREPTGQVSDNLMGESQFLMSEC